MTTWPHAFEVVGVFVCITVWIVGWPRRGR